METLDEVTKLFRAQVSAGAEEIEQTLGLFNMMSTIRVITETRLAPIFATITTKNAELTAENERLRSVVKHGFFATTLDGVMYSRFGDKRIFWCIYRYCPDDGEWLLGECHPIRNFNEYEEMSSVGQTDLGFIVEEAEDECYFHGDGVYLDKSKAEEVFATLKNETPAQGSAAIAPASTQGSEDAGEKE